VPSSIHTVSTDSATTIQNSVLPMRPIDVRQPWPRSASPLRPASAAVVTMGASARLGGRACRRGAARARWAWSTMVIMCRRETSAGT
jgi:hypothetical protein